MSCLKGYKQTEEHKNKIRLALSGKPKSEEHRQKLSLSKKGKHTSIDTEFKKGQHISKETEFKKTLQTKKYATYQAHKSFEKYYGISWKEMIKPENPSLHHINGDNSDNRFDNLCLISRSEHARIHHEVTK